MNADTYLAMLSLGLADLEVDQELDPVVLARLRRRLDVLARGDDTAQAA